MLAPDSRTRDVICDELLRQIEARSIRCGVIGLGFIGSVLMNALITAGFAARGYDRAAAAVARFSRARNLLVPAVESLCACDADPGVLAGCGVIFVAVRSLVNDGAVNEEPLHAAARVIRMHTRPCLVILESTVSPGTTRRCVVAQCSRYLARSLVHSIIVAGLRSVVVIGGFALAAGTAYLDLLRAAARECCDYELLRDSIGERLVLGAADEEACLLGAAVFASRKPRV